jgi:hypothetical protein
MGRKTDSKLTRISLGGLEQIPSFSGDRKDYSYINRVTFCGQKDRDSIKATDLRPGSVFYSMNQEYNPKCADSFLDILNGVLEDEGWYLAYCTRNRTSFRKHQRVNGALYTKKEKRGVSKTT